MNIYVRADIDPETIPEVREIKAELMAIKEDIESKLNAGYSLADLKENDKREIEGFIQGIYQTECAFDIYCADLLEDTVIGKLKGDIAQEIWEEVYNNLICDAVAMVYSIEDGEEYREE